MSEHQERALFDSPEFEIRKKQDGKRTVRGYAAVYDSLSEDLGGFREIIRKGAFDNALEEKQPVSARVQHEAGLSTVGTTESGTLLLGADSKGLWYEVDPPDTNAGRDLVALLERGDIRYSSFAFSVRDGGERWNWESDPPVRELLDVNLYDVAPVDGPAYRATSAEVRAQAAARLDQARVNRAIDETNESTDNNTVSIPELKVWIQ